MRASKFVGLTAMALGLVGGPAMAHHSFAMFDNRKEVTLDGTIKEFVWSNPHTFLRIAVKDPTTGEEVDWSIDGSSPNSLSRDGWSRNSAKPGDKAQVLIHPLKDGSAGGSLLGMTVNGITYKKSES